MKAKKSQNRPSDRREKTISALKYWAVLNAGILMMAVGIYFFKAPNGFATGGVSGISVVLKNLIPNESFTPGTYMLILNVETSVF